MSRSKTREMGKKHHRAGRHKSTLRAAPAAEGLLSATLRSKSILHRLFDSLPVKTVNLFGTIVTIYLFVLPNQPTIIVQAPLEPPKIEANAPYPSTVTKEGSTQSAQPGNGEGELTSLLAGIKAEISDMFASRPVQQEASSTPTFPSQRSDLIGLGTPIPSTLYPLVTSPAAFTLSDLSPGNTQGHDDGLGIRSAPSFLAGSTVAQPILGISDSLQGQTDIRNNAMIGLHMENFIASSSLGTPAIIPTPIEWAGSKTGTHDSALADLSLRDSYASHIMTIDSISSKADSFNNEILHGLRGNLVGQDANLLTHVSTIGATDPWRYPSSSFKIPDSLTIGSSVSNPDMRSILPQSITPGVINLESPTKSIEINSITNPQRPSWLGGTTDQINVIGIGEFSTKKPDTHLIGLTDVPATTVKPLGTYDSKSVAPAGQSLLDNIVTH